jgi:hypothetical protein
MEFARHDQIRAATRLHIEKLERELLDINRRIRERKEEEARFDEVSRNESDND